jgi:transposase InsO family protein
LTSFHKYAKILSYGRSRHFQPKIKYSSRKSYTPIEIWCTDLTILKITDYKKHYIHFLMDHFSKMILDYSVENSPNPKAIKNLLQETYLKHKSKTSITLVTDTGVEDVPTYNAIRPQISLQGNTPEETFEEKSLDINHYKTHLDNQKIVRITQNQQNRYKRFN